jgi:RimJ/RimL family protein N-acetyltransferase
MYASLSQKADCFILSAEGKDVGECRIQPIKSPFPEPLASSTDCRRIDIMIGEPDCWSKTYGSRAIGLLCRFAFENTSCSHLFAYGIFDYNERAKKAFERNGFKVYSTTPAEGDIPGEMVLFKGSINKIF